MSRVIVQFSLVCCLVAVLGSPAVAADGEVLISNAKALQGSVTPGDAAGYPVTISRPGSYKLIGPLNVADGRRGIDVTADDVTIDLNNFAITAFEPVNTGQLAMAAVVPKPVLTYGVYAPGKLRLTVRGGTIAKFKTIGVYDPTGSGAVVENMRLVSNGGAGVSLGDISRLEGSMIFDNGGVGAALGNQSIVRGNTIASNTRLTGSFNLSCGTRCLIDSNTVSNATRGQGVQVGAGSLVIGNVISGNASLGLSTSSGGVNNVAGFANNTIVGNNSGGIQVQGILSVHPNLCRPDSQFCD